MPYSIQAEQVLRHFDSLESNRRAVFSGIYFTLFSIIGGVAVGLIANQLSSTITAFTAPWNLSFTQWVTVVLAACTFVVVAVVLVAYVLTVTYFYWEPTIIDVFTPLTIGLALCLAAAHLDSPRTWLWWMSFFGFAAAWSLGRTAAQLKPRPGTGEIPALGDIASLEPLREELRDFAQRARERVISSLRWAIFGGSVLLVYAIAQDRLGWSPYDVFGIALVILLVCAAVLVNFRKAFKERHDVFGTPAYLMKLLAGNEPGEN